MVFKYKPGTEEDTDKRNHRMEEAANNIENSEPNIESSAAGPSRVTSEQQPNFQPIPTRTTSVPSSDLSCILANGAYSLTPIPPQVITIKY
jgi:hypothetical protein